MKNSAVLSSSFARKIFGNDDPVGKTFTINKINLTISGIFENMHRIPTLINAMGSSILIFCLNYGGTKNYSSLMILVPLDFISWLKRGLICRQNSLKFWNNLKRIIGCFQTDTLKYSGSND